MWFSARVRVRAKSIISLETETQLNLILNLYDGEMECGISCTMKIIHRKCIQFQIPRNILSAEWMQRTFPLGRGFLCGHLSMLLSRKS